MWILVHDRSPEGGPVLAPGETVYFSANNVTMVFGDTDPVGVGALFVTTE